MLFAFLDRLVWILEDRESRFALCPLLSPFAGRLLLLLPDGLFVLALAQVDDASTASANKPRFFEPKIRKIISQSKSS